LTLRCLTQYSFKHVTDVYIDWQEQHSLVSYRLSDGDYELGLTDFETYTITNVNSSIINFILTKMTRKLEISEELYELRDIKICVTEKYLKRAILRSRPNKCCKKKRLAKSSIKPTNTKNDYRW